MTNVPEVYVINLAGSGKLKLRATARLADGTPDDVFEACVMFHEAARLERRAVQALAPCPSATLLASLAEQCFSLLEGQDPPGAAEVWGRILDQRRLVGDVATADAILARVGPRYEASHGAYAELVVTCKQLLPMRTARTVVPASPTATRAALRDVRRILAAFAGIASFWWWEYRLTEALDDSASAWRALERARSLAPDNPRYLAMSLLAAAKTLEIHVADQYLGGLRFTLDRRGPEVSLMYAHAELELAARDGAHARERWLRAGEATRIGFGRVRSSNTMRRNLHAVALIVEARLAGREPTLDILYRAGLGELAAGAPPGVAVQDLIARHARIHVNEMATPIPLAA
jgi:hypothetical protein